MTEKEQKIVLIITFVGTIIAIVLGITLAFFRWQSDNDADVKITVSGLDIVYENGDNITGTLIPVQTKEEGLIKDVVISKNNNDTTKANFYLVLDTLPEGLKHESFVFEFYRDDELVDNGNFSLKNEGDTITLASHQEITKDASVYTLYLWIDGNMENPSSMQNQEFSFRLNVSATNTK